MSLVVSASSSVWQRSRVIVDANTTKVVDTLPILNFGFVHYYVHIRDVDSTRANSFQISVQRDDTGLTEIVFAKFGSQLDFDITSAEVGGQLQLSLENNEAFNVEFRFARLILD